MSSVGITDRIIFSVLQVPIAIVNTMIIFTVRPLKMPYPRGKNVPRELPLTQEKEIWTHLFLPLARFSNKKAQNHTVGSNAGQVFRLKSHDFWVCIRPWTNVVMRHFKCQIKTFKILAMFFALRQKRRIQRTWISFSTNSDEYFHLTNY